jgi:3-methyladenine DNA glycosylase AlkC
MGTNYSITESFGEDLAAMLSQKITTVYNSFDTSFFCKTIAAGLEGKSYTQRIIFFAETLQTHLPENYTESVKVLLAILGEENPNETGMFREYYWLSPVAKFVELFGLDNWEISINAIAEITKRNTGEYAIRPYIRKDPMRALEQMKKWALDENFHLRRLSSEGLRPKLPWAPKLDTFNENPAPVFDVLEILKEDKIKFVQKSVANHLTDWLKVNYSAVVPIIKRWSESGNSHTQWIIKRATRKHPIV